MKGVYFVDKETKRFVRSRVEVGDGKDCVPKGPLEY